MNRECFSFRMMIYYFRSTPIASTKCINQNDEGRPGFSKLRHTILLIYHYFGGGQKTLFWLTHLWCRRLMCCPRPSTTVSTTRPRGSSPFGKECRKKLGGRAFLISGNKGFWANSTKGLMNQPILLWSFEKIVSSPFNWGCTNGHVFTFSLDADNNWHAWFRWCSFSWFIEYLLFCTSTLEIFP